MGNRWYGRRVLASRAGAPGEGGLSRAPPGRAQPPPPPLQGRGKLATQGYWAKVSSSLKPGSTGSQHVAPSAHERCGGGASAPPPRGLTQHCAPFLEDKENAKRKSYEKGGPKGSKARRLHSRRGGRWVTNKWRCGSESQGGAFSMRE